MNNVQFEALPEPPATDLKPLPYEHQELLRDALAFAKRFNRWNECSKECKLCAGSVGIPFLGETPRRESLCTVMTNVELALERALYALDQKGR